MELKLITFIYSRKNCFARIDQRIIYLSTLPAKQQKLLDKYTKYLNSTKECVEANTRVIDKMLSNVDQLFINSRSNIEPQEIVSQIQDPDADKVHITLKQIVRDWTDLGSGERDQCYKPILNEIMEHFTNVNNSVNTQKNLFKVVSTWARHQPSSDDLISLTFSWYQEQD